MGRRLTPLGLFLKWVIVPVALGAAAYFFIGPEIGKTELASKVGKRLGIPLPRQGDDEPKEKEPEKEPQKETDRTGPEPEVEVSAQRLERRTLRNRSRNRSKNRSRRRRPRPSNSEETRTYVLPAGHSVA